MATKNIMITGGKRVGSDLARRLAQNHKANIIMTYYNSKASIEQTLLQIKQTSGVETLAVQADLSNADQATSAVQAVINKFGRIDALVNMASIFPRTPFESLTPTDFEKNIAANLAAPYFTAVSAAQSMLKQTPDHEGFKGRIINFGDWAIDRPYKHYLPYLVAKGGLKTMTLAMANELAPHITVNMIQPALIDPPPHMTDEDIQDVISCTPLKRIGSASDVNELVLYLLYSTNFVTGTCIRVDGGRFLSDGGVSEQV